MSRTTIYMVCDDAETVEKAKSYFGGYGVTVNSYNSDDWKKGLGQNEFKHQLMECGPALVNHNEKSNVIPFVKSGGETVTTMNQLESKAIQEAIHQFRGNLTEAAKALGIGRATLYRKVKQYQIDPSSARRKRAA